MNKVSRLVFLLMTILLLVSCRQGVVISPSISIDSSPTSGAKLIATRISPSPDTTALHPTATLILKTLPSITPPTKTTNPSYPEGLLYLWTMGGVIPPLYTNVDLEKGIYPEEKFFEVSPELMFKQDHTTTVGLRFAPYSQMVAFTTLTDGMVDLWLADLDLKHVEHLWRDSRKWLGEIMSPDVYIQWGPGEKSLVITSAYAESVQENLVIVSLASKEAIESKGVCDQIAPAPGSDQFTVWCTLMNNASTQYGILGLDGEISTSSTPPENSREVFAWAFSPDGQNLAYAPKDGDIVILDRRGEKTEIPVYRNRIVESMRQPALQWSMNGDRLLVNGFNKAYCPLHEDMAFGGLRESECWLVFDAGTGEILWSPSERITEATGISLKNFGDYCAGLSPDGNWLAICYGYGAINFFLIISLQDGTIINYHPFQTLDFRWVDTGG